jgi:hypothetical protein
MDYMKRLYDNSPAIVSLSLEQKLARYGVQLDGNWDNTAAKAAYAAVRDAGWREAYSKGVSSPESAFKSAFDTNSEKPLVMKKVNSYDYLGESFSYGAVTRSSHLIEFANISYYSFQSVVNNIVHELGHAYDAGHEIVPRESLPSVFVDNRSTILHPTEGTRWQMNSSMNSYETFADFYVAWMYDVWGPDANTTFDGATQSPKDWMTTNMSEWTR